MRQVGQFSTVPFVVVLCLLVLVGCGRLGSSDPGGGHQKPAFTSSGDTRQDLRAGLSRLKSAYPYRIVDELTYSGSPALKATTRVVEYGAADRIHYKLDSYEGIEIGDQNYGYYGGKWVETGTHAKPAEGDIEDIITNHMIDVRLAGTEDVNGVSCALYATRYEFTSKGVAGSGNSKVWIATADGLPRRLDSEVKRGDSVSKAHRVYEYNRGIKVEKPVP